MKRLLLALSACLMLSGCVVYPYDADYPRGYTQYCDETGACYQVQYYTGYNGVVYYYHPGYGWIGPGHEWYGRYHEYHFHGRGYHSGFRGGFHGGGGRHR
jgi:hypothetical protein